MPKAKHPAAQAVVDRVMNTPRIISWSHSRLQTFESCKHRARLKYADKVPEPERPLPPGKLEHANDRGTRIHDNGELYVRGKAKLCRELLPYRAEYEKLVAMYKTKKVFIEDEWGMDREWEPCPFNDKRVWLRLKLDYLVRVSSDYAVVVDLKTGRRQGNEIKHSEQVQLYQLVTFLRHPELERVDVELWYPDIDDIFQQSYTRDQGLRFKRGFDNRGTTITTHEFTDERADANPSIFTCRYCMYGKKGSGICTRGV